MGRTLPPGMVLRTAQPSDARAIADLVTAVDRSFGLGPWVTEADVREDLEDPDLALGTDTWLVEDADGIVGYSEIWNTRRADAEALEAQGWVLPSRRGLGLGTFLVDRFERAAVAAAPSLERRPLLVRTYFTAEDDAARALFAARGYELVRHFFHMSVDLDAVSADPPDVPDGLTLRALDPGTDGRAVHELIEHAFSEHWNWTAMTFENFWRRIAGRDDFDPSLNLLAFEGERLVGAALNVIKLGEGWVNDLGVHRDARGRGIGELMLRHSLALFKSRGLQKAALGVDASNATGAVRLYERVGMNVVRRFDTYDKELDV